MERRQKGTVANPAGYLTRAIQGRWKPATKLQPLNRQPTNPPSAEQMMQLEEAKVAGLIKGIYAQPDDDGTAVVVDDGRQAVSWWKFLEVDDGNTL